MGACRAVRPIEFRGGARARRDEHLIIPRFPAVASRQGRIGRQAPDDSRASPYNWDDPKSIEEDGPRDASDVSGHRTPGRRHRRRSCRGRSTRLAEALPIRLDFRPSTSRWRIAGRSGKAVYDEAVESIDGDQGRPEAPDDHGRGEPQRGPPPAARPLGDPPAGLHDPRRADELPPRARPGHRPDRHRRDLRRPRPDDRRGRRRQPADRRAAAGPRGGAVRLQPGPQDRQAGHQRVEVHDPEGDRRPVRAASPRRSPASSPRSRTTSSCSTPCSAR